MCTVSSVYDEVTITNKRSLRAALKQQRAIPAGTQEHILQWHALPVVNKDFQCKLQKSLTLSHKESDVSAVGQVSE